MVTAASDVDRAEIAHAAEAIGIDDGCSADRRVRNTGLGNLEQHAAQRVVDLLVVLVLTFREASKDRAEAEVLKQIRVAESGGQWNGQRDLIAVSLDDDPTGGEGRQLRVGVPGRANGRIEFSMDHAVGTVP